MSCIKIHLDFTPDEDIQVSLKLVSTLDDFFSNIKELRSSIEKNIKVFHSLLSQPITGTIWEELLAKSFTEIGYETTWKPDNSHKVGEDMRIISLENSRISCKSGVITYNRTHKLGECVQFSSSRTTSFKTLEEKLDHLSKRHYDYHFMLSKKDKFDGLQLPEDYISKNANLYGAVKFKYISHSRNCGIKRFFTVKALRVTPE